MSLERYEGHPMLCSEKQKSVAMDQCPEPDLTQITLSRERIKWRWTSLTGRPVLPSVQWAAKQRGAAPRSDTTPPSSSGCEVSQICAWPLPPAGQLSAFPRSWVLLTAEVCPPWTQLVWTQQYHSFWHYESHPASKHRERHKLHIVCVQHFTAI